MTAPQHPTLDELLREPGILIIPGAYDALSARIAAKAGARCIYMTGFGVAGASYGVPDIGLVSAEQMSERVRAIASAIGTLPLIADGDNGYGGPVNVARLVRDYERAGAQAIQLEDQVSPKRCGHMEGKKIVPLADAVANIRAAAATRSDASFKIMARTDAMATDGIDEALRRGEAFLGAGADILFVEAPRSESELERIGRHFRGVPLVVNLVEDGKTPLLDASDLERMGYRIMLRPIAALLAVAQRLETAYAAILDGRLDIGERVNFSEFNALVGLPDLSAFVTRCGKE
jgi:2,3-dimethylmalate lyase